ncbi:MULTISPECIES: GNAT family N-acetyltransferase [unclassified Chryseobacterium]|uniref:GNAT family N-acetyltransferase n=1 Tax=unclassified Chryseobacterium TaxID=2593645 RepID=UPI001AE39A5C|nr:MULTISPECIES: GNAT family N-acetyltransferase [unclassified Chryseobacterium]MBP1164709.1 RimJ/RimL family protein N-acetyltransferase [Chryseobacterium sp. PvR013]MDR4890712.1 GNAT family N-acetyltransferase [Chryseobacterium sp. CFS7]
MNFSVQPVLENEEFQLIPLQQGDFESLYEVASDPKVWEQHPNKDRYKREVFENFFTGAMESRGAFKIMEKATGNVLGSSRYYDFDEEDNHIFIGYTFYGTNSWGKGINPQVKKLMLDYIFQFVDKVHFHIGKENFRSQTALERLGGQKIAEEEVAYFAEPSRTNFVYEIKKDDWA